MAILKMTDLDLNDKRVLIREDLNVPLKDGEITNDKRIKAAFPIIKEAITKNARVIVLSHLGRPTEGKYEEQFSLAPIAKRLSEMLGQDVRLEKEWRGSEKPFRSSSISLLRKSSILQGVFGHLKGQSIILNQFKSHIRPSGWGEKSQRSLALLLNSQMG